MATTAALRLQPTTVPPGPQAPARAALRLVEGGRAPRSLARRAQLRRRRLAALVVVLVVLVASTLLASAVLARIAGGGSPSAAAGGPPPTSAAASSAAGVAAGAGGATRIVQPGDTLWTIAAAVAPAADVRITVDRLAALNGGAPLVVGQRLLLP